MGISKQESEIHARGIRAREDPIHLLAPSLCRLTRNRVAERARHLGRPARSDALATSLRTPCSGREQCVLLSAELMTEPRVEQARASSDSLS